MGDFEEALAEADTATELHFRFGEGKQLDSRIARFHNLVELQLRDVPPDCVLPEELLALPKLRELGISGADDRLVFPALVPKLPIERLTVWDASAAELPPLPNLKRLELVTKDPAADVVVLAERFSHLVELRVWGSHLDKGELPPDIERFRNLEVLELVSCGLSALPDAIAKLSLRKLNISGCPMPVFPEIVTQMTQLEVLEIGQQISGLPNSIANLVNLRELDIGRALNKGAMLSRWDDATKMKALPRVLGELVNLEKLDIDCCGVFELEALRTLKKLKWLSMSWSAVTSVDVLGELPALEVLSIEHADRVKDLAPLGKCTALRELDISNTKPKSLDFLRALKSLKKLDVSSIKCKRMEALYDLEVELEADDDTKTQYEARASLRSMPSVASIVEQLASRDLATAETACGQLAMWAAAASSRDENALAGALGLKSVYDEDDEGDDDDDEDDEDEDDDDDDDDDEGDEDSGAVQAGGYLPALDTALDRHLAQLSGGVLAKLFGVTFHSVSDNFPCSLRIARELVSRDDHAAQCAMIDGFKAALEYYDAGHREHDDTVHDVLLDEVFPLLGGPALSQLLAWCANDHLHSDGGDGMASLFVPALQRATGADFDAVIARLEKYVSSMLDYSRGIERAAAMWQVLAPLESDAQIQTALFDLRARLEMKLAARRARENRNKRLEGETTAAAALLELAALSDEDHKECQAAMWSANEVPNLPPESRRALLVAWQRRDHDIGLGDALCRFASYVPLDELRSDLDALTAKGAERGALLRKAIVHGIEKELAAGLDKLRVLAGELDGMPPHVAASAEIREMIFGGAENWNSSKFEAGIQALAALPEYAPPPLGEDEDDRHGSLASMVANLCESHEFETLHLLARHLHKLKIDGKPLERVLAQLVAACMVGGDPEGLHAILPLVPAEITWDILAFNLACKYARESDRENTFELTKRALELGKSPDQFLSDTDFEEFAADQEFVALLDAHR